MNSATPTARAAARGFDPRQAGLQQARQQVLEIDLAVPGGVHADRAGVAGDELGELLREVPGAPGLRRAGQLRVGLHGPPGRFRCRDRPDRLLDERVEEVADGPSPERQVVLDRVPERFREPGLPRSAPGTPVAFHQST